VLSETDGSDVTQAEYTLEQITYGDLLSERRSNASSFYHFDALGSADRLTNSAQTVTDSYVYEAFGTVKAGSGSTVNPFRYVGTLGYYWDADAALHYLSARYYVTMLSRFLPVDPAWLGTGAERYVYVGARPTFRADAGGLDDYMDIGGPGSVGIIRSRACAVPAAVAVAEMYGKVDNRYLDYVVGCLLGRYCGDLRYAP
jgi:RHS repeat-associated protein